MRNIALLIATIFGFGLLVAIAPFAAPAVLVLSYQGTSALPSLPSVYFPEVPVPSLDTFAQIVLVAALLVMPWTINFLAIQFCAHVHRHRAAYRDFNVTVFSLGSLSGVTWYLESVFGLALSLILVMLVTGLLAGVRYGLPAVSRALNTEPRRPDITWPTFTTLADLVDRLPAYRPGVVQGTVLASSPITEPAAQTAPVQFASARPPVAYPVSAPPADVTMTLSQRLAARGLNLDRLDDIAADQRRRPRVFQPVFAPA
jgi:hypothetical protein